MDFTLRLILRLIEKKRTPVLTVEGAHTAGGTPAEWERAAAAISRRAAGDGESRGGLCGGAGEGGGRHRDGLQRANAGAGNQDRRKHSQIAPPRLSLPAWIEAAEEALDAVEFAVDHRSIAMQRIGVSL